VQFVALKFTVVSSLQPVNAFAGILVTLLPIFKVEIDEHPTNTLLAIVVQFVALKFTVVSPLQIQKAQLPMRVTELGIVIDVSPLQP
jgi:hypothetical protein